MMQRAHKPPVLTLAQRHDCVLDWQRRVRIVIARNRDTLHRRGLTVDPEALGELAARMDVLNATPTPPNLRDRYDREWSRFALLCDECDLLHDTIKAAEVAA